MCTRKNTQQIWQLEQGNSIAWHNVQEFFPVVFERELNRCAQIFTSAQYSHAFQMLTLLIRKSLLQSGDQLLRWHRLFITGNTAALPPAPGALVCAVTSYSTHRVPTPQQLTCITSLSHCSPGGKLGPPGAAACGVGGVRAPQQRETGLISATARKIRAGVTQGQSSPVRV